MPLTLNNRGDSGLSYSKLSFAPVAGFAPEKINGNQIMLAVNMVAGPGAAPRLAPLVDVVLDLEQTLVLIDFLVKTLPEIVRREGLPGQQLHPERYVSGKNLSDVLSGEVKLSDLFAKRSANGWE